MTSASSPPGTRGATRSTANNSVSGPAPIAKVAPPGVAQVPEQVHELGDRVARAFSIPNSYGSWLTVTKIASPNTKPSITGRDRNCATKPSRSSPATANMPPQTRTSTAASDA